MRKEKTNINLYLLAMMLFLFFIGGGSVLGAGSPMVIDYNGEISNGIKTEAVGTINTISDLSNGSFKVKLFTKSEQDPAELEPFILDGPVQITDFYQTSVLNGNLVNQTDSAYMFDVSGEQPVLPSVYFPNVAKNKAGQIIDLKVSITDIRSGQESEYLSINKGANSAVGITIKNMGGVNVSYQFIESNSQQPIDLLIFPAISDVDYKQVFGLNAIPLGNGSNLIQTNPGVFESDGTPVNGITEFPLGGIMYQFFGHTLLGTYESDANLLPSKSANGFDVFGAYGTSDDVEITKPDFGEVQIPKASWEIEEEKYIPGNSVTAQLSQPINALDININHRYENWETKFTLPSSLKQTNIQLIDSNGQVVASKTEVLDAQQQILRVSKETMKELSFSGETYHFVINGILDKELVDETILQFIAETNVDGIKDELTYETLPIKHKAKITVKYLRQESTDAVLKKQVVELGYGKPWKIDPEIAPEGYYIDTENNPTDTSGERVDFEEKNIIFYYAPLEKNITIRYLDELGQLLGESHVTGNYQESYATTAEDIADEYSLIVEKIPENASGIIGNTDSQVVYYYRKTKGFWMNLGLETRGITRTDYHGHIRSNTLNYSDGHILTFVNTENGLLIYQDTVEDGAVSEVEMTFGSQINLTLGNEGSVSVNLTNDGIITVNRQTDLFEMVTKIEKGNFDHKTSLFSDKKIVETHHVQANGVAGIVFNKEIIQLIEDTYRVVSKQGITDDKKAQANQLMVNAPPTYFETKLSEEESVDEKDFAETSSDIDEATTSQRMNHSTSSRALFLSEDESLADDEEIMAGSEALFTQKLTGSAVVPADEAVIPDEEVIFEEIDDETRSMQYLEPSYNISVYQKDELIAESKVPESEVLEVVLDEPTTSSKSPDEGNADITLHVSPTEEAVVLAQKSSNGKLTPIEEGRLPQLGMRPSSLWMIILGIVLVVCAFLLKNKSLNYRRNI